MASEIQEQAGRARLLQSPGRTATFGGCVARAKAATSLPHSKGMVYHLVAPQMVNERVNDY